MSMAEDRRRRERKTAEKVSLRREAIVAVEEGDGWRRKGLLRTILIGAGGEEYNKEWGLGWVDWGMGDKFEIN